MNIVEWCKEYYQAAWTFGLTILSIIVAGVSFWFDAEMLGNIALCVFYVIGSLSALMLILWACFSIEERLKGQ